MPDRARGKSFDPSGGREIGFRGAGRVAVAIHTPSPESCQDTVTSGAHVAFVLDPDGNNVEAVLKED